MDGTILVYSHDQTTFLRLLHPRSFFKKWPKYSKRQKLADSSVLTCLIYFILQANQMCIKYFEKFTEMGACSVTLLFIFFSAM